MTYTPKKGVKVTILIDFYDTICLMSLAIFYNFVGLPLCAYFVFYDLGYCLYSFHTKYFARTFDMHY